MQWLADMSKAQLKIRMPQAGGHAAKSTPGDSFVQDMFLYNSFGKWSALHFAEVLLATNVWAISQLLRSLVTFEVEI